MLQTKREPLNKDEQMIYNNYLAIRFIQDHSSDDLTPALVCELHKIVTEKTLENEDKAGKLRPESVTSLRHRAQAIDSTSV